MLHSLPLCWSLVEALESQRLSPRGANILIEEASSSDDDPGEKCQRRAGAKGSRRRCTKLGLGEIQEGSSKEGTKVHHVRQALETSIGFLPFSLFLINGAYATVVSLELLPLPPETPSHTNI